MIDEKNEFDNNDIISADDPDWGNDEDVLSEETISKHNDDLDNEWDDTDWDDIEWDYEEFSESIQAEEKTQKNVYNIDGYGEIADLYEYLENSKGVIELLEHARDKEQFNYILGMSHTQAHDEELLEYLISKDYSIEDYISTDVGYMFFQYKELFEYFVNKSDNENIKPLLLKVKYVDEKIANIISKREDRNELIRENYEFRDKIVVEKIINYFEENSENADFGFVELCDLDTENIRKLLDLGYKIDENAPYNIMQNNEIMREEFLKSIETQNEEILRDIDRELKNIPGGYGKLYKSANKNLFCDEFINNFEKEEFEQIIKYIILSDYDIDFSNILEENKTQFLKSIYDNVNDTENFNIELFVSIVSKYNMYKEVLDEANIEGLDENLKIFFEQKDLKIKDIDDIINIKQTIFKNNSDKIANSNNSLDVKDIICKMLTNQTYLETKKGLLETGSSEKLNVLKNSIQDENKNKEIDTYIIFSNFFYKIDKVTDINELKQVANSLNQETLENGFNENLVNLNSKIMNLYNHEINEKMTDFNEYITDRFYGATDYTYTDGTNVNGKRVNLAHIKSGEQFNGFIHVLNAYQNGGTTGTIESIVNSKFIGQAYISLTGISDEYNRICANHDSRSAIKVLYSNIPEENLFCASNRDTGINACSNSKNVSTRLPKNMMPFRRLVRNTEVHGSETYNEYDVYRDNLIPSGIAFMGDEPTQEEINTAAYLNVPLVQIDDLQEAYRKDLLSLNRGGVSYDESFYHIKEHNYENKENDIIPNNNYDKMLLDITENLIIDDEEAETLKIISKSDESGKDEYFSIIGEDEYEVNPIYDYVDSTRVNIDCKDFERDFVKIKLYDLLKTESKLKCAYGKYPSGRISLSLLENMRKDNEIDKCISYLTDFRNDLAIENIPEEYKQKLKILSKINDKHYLELFENMIISDSYIEPQKFMKEVLERKYKVQELVNDRNISLEDNEVISTLQLGIQASKAINNVELFEEYEKALNNQEKEILSTKDNLGIGENNG